jgi:hypothetical protein
LPAASMSTITAASIFMKSASFSWKTYYFVQILYDGKFIS